LVSPAVKHWLSIIDKKNQSMAPNLHPLDAQRFRSCVSPPPLIKAQRSQQQQPESPLSKTLRQLDKPLIPNHFT
jgi:hypothetical protein